MRPILVDTAPEARQICIRLNQEKTLALDCEGIDLGPTGKLTLAQISTPDDSTWIFDIHTCPEIAEILRPIFESESILKIVHDCRSERSNLREQFGIQLRNVFDTQIAFYIMKPFKNNRISLTNLSFFYKVPKNPLKDKFQTGFYEANPDFWARRPLSNEMILYATADIANLHLFYEKLKCYGNSHKFLQLCAKADLKESDLFVDGVRNPNLRFIL